MNVSAHQSCVLLRSQLVLGEKRCASKLPLAKEADISGKTCPPSAVSHPNWIGGLVALGTSQRR